MGRSVSIRRSLLTSFVPVVLLLGAVFLLLAYLGSQRTVRRFSASLIEQTEQRTEARLAAFFLPVERIVELLGHWADAGLLDLEDPDSSTEMILPLLEEYPWASSVQIADDQGRELMVLRRDGHWRVRQTRPDEWQGTVEWWDWEGAEPWLRTVSQENLDYDPRKRPWYEGARRSLDQGGGVHWTEPYVFFTSKEPGITAALALRGGEGRLQVVAMDVLLSDISRFTTAIEVHRRGVVFVTTGDGRLIGLPGGATEGSELLLRRPEDLQAPLAQDAAAALEIGEEAGSLPTRFRSGGEQWWGQVKPFELSDGERLLIGVAVPEVELLGDLRHQRWLIGGVTLIVLGVAIGRAVALARRFGTPIEQLASESERMATGDLEPGPPIESSVSEVDRLAGAHEHMRVGLQTLLKLEGDLQVARRIQQNTFPEKLPELAGFEIDAWNDPADETGGDTYDVIGLTRGENRQILSEGPAEEAVLLLADATGHGIGPALSATQLRAMLRVAVRVSSDVAAIGRLLNEQTYQDLPTGRFVTAWLGYLDVADHSLTSFSAGQAPLLHYRAADDEVRSLVADTIPLGMMPKIDHPPLSPIAMEPGDIFAVMSDGIYEASGESEEQFGAERVIELLHRNSRKTPAEISAAVRVAVEDFTGGGPADDDRTIVIVKRT